MIFFYESLVISKHLLKGLFSIVNSIPIFSDIVCITSYSKSLLNKNSYFFGVSSAWAYNICKSPHLYYNIYRERQAMHTDTYRFCTFVNTYSHIHAMTEWKKNPLNMLLRSKPYRKKNWLTNCET